MMHSRSSFLAFTSSFLPPIRFVSHPTLNRCRTITASAADPQTDPGISSIISATRYQSSFHDTHPHPIPLDLVPKADWDDYVQRQDQSTKEWLSKFDSPSAPIPVPNFENASILKYAVPVKPASISVWRAASAFTALPKAMVFEIADAADFTDAQLELAWAFNAYTYTAYKKPEQEDPSSLVRLTKPGSAERKDVDRALSATFMVRDMISTPAEDFGPANLEAAVSTLAAQHAARSSSIVGQQLLRLGYPQVHRVGRAAAPDRAPRLLELVWNESAKKTITLVGKGICYDTGGLSIKPTNSMITMKKDMGGAAQVLGLAHMIMDAKLNVRLRVLIPAAENAIDGSSYRPGDVLTARNGTTTLNSNSDAEGRLVLADALVAASEEEPDLIIDCATLTGAQRVALGPDVPSIFCTDDDVADKLFKISEDIEDLVWRLPLYAPYRKLLDTPLADIKSCGSGSYGGAITAALYLKEFVGDSNWIHVDMMGYNTTSSPGRPEGGEAMGMRALFDFLRERYSKSVADS